MSTRAFICAAIITVASVQNTFAQGEDTIAQRSKWAPSVAQFQFAGFVGMFSAGVGYHYWQKKASSVFMYGYVPGAYATSAIHTIALKNSFSFFNYNKVFHDSLLFNPVFYAGFSINCEVSKHAYITLPDYYPAGYYDTQAIHLTIFTGASAYIPLIKNGQRGNALAPYVEVGTVDNYLWYLVSGRLNDPSDIFRMAIGVTYYFR